MGDSRRKERTLISGVHRQGGRQGRLGPVLVGFEHGQVDPESFRHMSPELRHEFASTTSSTGEDMGPAVGATPKLELNIATDKLSYSSSAKSVKSRMGGNPYQRTLLAIRNKRTHRVKLIETSSVCVGALVEPPASTNSILLKEELAKAQEEEEASKDDEEKRLARLTMNKHLVGEFGQTKGKRAYEQADRMKVESNVLSDKLSRAAMAVDQASVALPTDLAAASTADALIPPCNREAVLVNDVYKLDDMLTKDELKALGEAADELLENYKAKEDIDAGVEARTLSKLFASHLAGGKAGGKRSLATAIYMEAIVQFVNMGQAGFSKGPRGIRQAHIPLLIKQKVFREFTSLQGTVSPETRDKAMCHVIVLALIASSVFNADFSLISASLRVKADQVKRLSRLVGATVQTDALTKRSFIVLKLPLASFDMTATYKKRGGKR